MLVRQADAQVSRLSVLFFASPGASRSMPASPIGLVDKKRLSRAQCGSARNLERLAQALWPIPLALRYRCRSDIEWPVIAAMKRRVPSSPSSVVSRSKVRRFGVRRTSSAIRELELGLNGFRLNQRLVILGEAIIGGTRSDNPCRVIWQPARYQVSMRSGCC